MPVGFGEFPDCIQLWTEDSVVTKNVLLVSRHPNSLSPRAAALKAAGFTTIPMRLHRDRISSLAHFNVFRIIVLDQTIEATEQREIIELLKQISPLYHVICLRTDSVPSAALVRECLTCAREKGWGGVHRIDEGLVPLIA